jgi:hypothetical protein
VLWFERAPQLRLEWRIEVGDHLLARFESHSRDTAGIPPAMRNSSQSMLETATLGIGILIAGACTVAEAVSPHGGREEAGAHGNRGF